MATVVVQDPLERRSRSITRPDRTWLNYRAASREIRPTPQLSYWSWPIMRQLEGQILIPQEPTLSFVNTVWLRRREWYVCLLYLFFFYLRRTASRQAGDNGLYVGGGMEELTGSPGSNNSGDMPAQKQCLVEIYYCSSTSLYLQW